MIANTVLDWVFNEHGFRLTSWNQPFLTPACLQEYACAIARQGSPLTNCFGFIDGTVRPICRPGEKQRVVYNGHKRVHALKISIRSSAKWFDSKSLWSRGDVLCLYGDPAYPLRPHLMAPYRIGEVPVFTADMEAFNSAMSSARASVEWLFGDISNSFKFLDFKKNLKLGLSAVGKQYI
ncbi:unnamed protein product [Pocillopora meandrina]|uniref:DDE Tnp4 domain-containing protein n=1 Tax=Pocillopora meandrina TaxID=46732 RepID=A0AAU9XK11_9CNID|nr:unnamed protein product [Pocillopora meandrina]